MLHGCFLFVQFELLPTSQKRIKDSAAKEGMVMQPELVVLQLTLAQCALNPLFVPPHIFLLVLLL